MDIKRLARHDGFFLTAIVFAVLGIHGSFLIEGFGEQDMARLVNDAIIWRDNPGYPSAPEAGYRPRVLPLSLILIRAMLESGVVPSALPAILNTINLICGALVLVPLFLIWRRLADRQSAYLALAFVSTTPALWFASIYGYPHLVSFTLFVSALYLFVIALDHRGGAFVALSFAAAVVLGIGLGIKADLILAGGALFGALWLQGRVTVATVLAALTIGAFGLFVPWVLHELIFPPTVDAASYITNWNSRYPMSLGAVTNPHNLLVNLRTSGSVYFVAILFALVYLWRRHEERRIVVFVLLWALPVVVFWDLRIGNSARHVMSAFVPMALVLALLVQRLFSRRRLRLGAAAVLLLANYALGTPSADIVAPSTRLIASSRLLQEKVSRLHREAAAIARLDDARIFVVGSWANPYAIFAMLAKARMVHQGDDLILTLANGETQRFARAYVRDLKEARYLAAQKRAQGYRVVSLSYDDAELAQAGR